MAEWNDHMSVIKSILCFLLIGCCGSRLTEEQRAFRRLLSQDKIKVGKQFLSKYDGAFIAWGWIYHVQDLILHNHKYLAVNDLIEICEHVPTITIRYYDEPLNFFIHDGIVVGAIYQVIKKNWVTPVEKEVLLKCVKATVDAAEPYWDEQFSAYRSFEEGFPHGPVNYQINMVLPLILHGNPERAEKIITKIMTFIEDEGFRYSFYHERAEDVAHSNHLIHTLNELGRAEEVEYLKSRFHELTPNGGTPSVWAWCLAGKTFPKETWPTDYKNLLKYPGSIAYLGLLRTSCLGVDYENKN